MPSDLDVYGTSVIVDVCKGVAANGVFEIDVCEAIDVRVAVAGNNVCEADVTATDVCEADVTATDICEAEDMATTGFF